MIIVTRIPSAIFMVIFGSLRHWKMLFLGLNPLLHLTADAYNVIYDILDSGAKYHFLIKFHIFL